jgi:hypothetical protein
MLQNNELNLKNIGHSFGRIGHSIWSYSDIVCLPAGALGKIV